MPPAILQVDNVMPGDLIARLIEYDNGLERGPNEHTDRTKRDILEGPTWSWLLETVYTDTLRERCAEFHDLAWRCYADQACPKFEAAVSRYPANGRGYTWHTDHGIDSRGLVFIAGLTDFDGGDVEWTRERFRWDVDEPEDVEPEGRLEIARGRLTMFPAWYCHRVLPATTERIVCHGHFSV